MDIFGSKIFADNRFEKAGVILQMNANSWDAAKDKFNETCLLCCTKDVGAVKCAGCKIREAFLVNAEIIFRSKLSEVDKEWIKEEKELR